MRDDALRGRIVVVTGGTAGVGYAAALAFAELGARVVALARDAERVSAVAAALRRHAGTALTLDVADGDAVYAVADEIESTLGPIDVWVNNAMATVFGRFADVPAEDFARATQVTYLGAVHGTRAALRYMRPRDRGVVIQVGSALAFQSIPLQSAYCGAKHAIRGFTNAVRAELLSEHSRVRLCSVHLSAFNTPQFGWARSYLSRHPRPLAPVFSPAIAADAIVRAARRPRREYWVGWPAVQTIWASRLVPSLAERLAARIAVKGQQIADERLDGRTGNLETPVPRAAGAEGRFAAETRHRSLQWLLTTHARPAAMLVAAVLALVVAVAWLAS